MPKIHCIEDWKESPETFEFLGKVFRKHLYLVSKRKKKKKNELLDVILKIAVQRKRGKQQNGKD